PDPLETVRIRDFDVGPTAFDILELDDVRFSASEADSEVLLTVISGRSLALTFDFGFPELIGGEEELDDQVRVVLDGVVERLPALALATDISDINAISQEIAGYDMIII
ncbi:MAG: hypothetical protein AAGD43_33290, partial [Pseudomonadota bacterium]